MIKMEIAKESIESFSVNESEYFRLNEANGITIIGDGSVFLKRPDDHPKIQINFGNSKGCKIFLGQSIRGNISVFFQGSNSLLFVGDNCKLNSLQIRSCQSDDFIAIGAGVTVNPRNVWISGNGAGKSKPAIIIGDDCMFSYDVVIRNSDAHPIFSLETEEQINEPKGIVHVEPHVWIGEQVSILKSVKVGACSILSLGCIVTKDVPRFSVATGVPAVARVKNDIFWARSANKHDRALAKYFVNKYKN